MLEKYEQYMTGILSGEIVSCKWVRLAVERQVRDLQRQRAADFPYYFDEAEAGRVLVFFSCLTLTKNEWAQSNTPFILEPWQCFILACIFGWQHVNGGRRFMKAYEEVTRKNGKSEKAGGIMLYSILENQGADNCEIYSAASSRDQAGVSFMAMKNMAIKVKGKFSWANKLRIQERKVMIGGSKAEAVSSDAGTLQGLSPKTAIIDELHVHPSRAVMNAIESGQGSVTNPLIFIITTAGDNIEGVCYQYRKMVCNVLEQRMDDERMFGIIYTVDEGDDPITNRDCWPKAIPNLGVSVKTDWLEGEVQAAINEGGAKMNEVLNKNFNIWTRSHSTWIKDSTWMESGQLFNEVDLVGRMCFGGLDLAETDDLCALTLEFPPLGDELMRKGDVRVVYDEEGVGKLEMRDSAGIFQEMTPEEVGDIMDYRQIYRFYCPKDTAYERSKRDKVDYVRWAEEGLITLTPGNTTDYEYIRNDINKFREKYRLHSIAYDRYNSSQLVINLQDDGVRMEKFTQSVPMMNAPTVDFQKTIQDGYLAHNANPVMRWMMGNVMVRKDANGNIKINKEKATEKVDGPVSAVMARGQFMTYRQEFIDAFSPNLDMISL